MNYIESEDGNVFIFFCFNIEETLSNKSLRFLQFIEDDIKASIYLEKKENYDKKSFDLNDYISYLSPKYAKEKFNADSIATYSLPILNGIKFKNKIVNNKVFVLMKNNRGFITLYCFYTPRGKKQLNNYMNIIEEMFWYKESFNNIIKDVDIVPFKSINPPTII